jgi:hypothetical protein
MKLQIKSEITTEIDIEFPYFAKNGIHAYCFISQNECVGVRLGEYTTARIEHYSVYPESWLLDTKCTQDEFLAHYQNAQAELTLLYHELFSKNNILEL